MDVSKLGTRDFFTLALEIGHLTGNELQRTGRFRDLQDDILDAVALPSGAGGGDLKGLSQQRISSKNRNTLAESLMIRRFPAPQIVIIHAGQVVMN